ncbi:MAG: PAS-domain containing protein, partial [Methylobacteriaceae bacterium]|nr:PAS-domain containing protein [Methylobacteriaceae bacterium]
MRVNARSGLLRPTAFAAAGLASSFAAGADATPGLRLPHALDAHNAVGVAVLVGLVLFATALATLHIRERRRWVQREQALVAKLGQLADASDRADLLIGTERQLVAVWDGRGAAPSVQGDLSVSGHAGPEADALAFDAWLPPIEAGRIAGAVERLRERGESFSLTLRTRSGGFVDAEGRAVGGRALLRLRDVTGLRSGILRAESEAAQTQAGLKALQAFLDALGQPIWLRSPEGRLAYANQAYATAVEASDPDDAARRSLELLDRADRERALAERGRGNAYRARVAAIVAGQRRVLDITEAPLPGGCGGIALDVSELEAMRAELQREMHAHVRTLDQLPTAVAMFDATQRLAFHNAAYRTLWGLDVAFLDTRPSDGEILDRLRAARRLPEQADFRAWKVAMLSAYQAVEPQESWWHLPDRRTLRVVTNPNPQGGLTYLFDDVSDRLQLESRYNALIRVQTETLDALGEGVALFGTDGRLKLFNRAFAELWRLDAEALGREPHIENLVALCRPLAPAESPWEELREAVFGYSDMRVRSSVRMERRDGSVLECAAEPLPDGATLLTFSDVTASVNVERALTDRNEALELSARLRNEFVHHVSYELRSPLQNIIGFTEFLGQEAIGPLNDRQREYAQHIRRSSDALLTIINDILDLASIDTDTIELVREEVDIRATIEAAAKGVEDRIVEARLTLAIDVPADIGSFQADAKRIRQILFNLLSNAAGFSSPGQTIRVAATREADEIIVSVADEGRGIPDDVKAHVFDRFTSHTRGTTHRGVG